MKIRLLSIAALILGLAACNNSDKRTLAPETIFDGQGQQVITSFFNKKQGTTTTLYGNDPAQNAAATENNHVAGEVFTLITSKQEPNPYWYGSNINGEIESVEELKVEQDGQQLKFNYKVLKQGRKLNKQARINFILGLKAMVFP